MLRCVEGQHAQLNFNLYNAPGFGITQRRRTNGTSLISATLYAVVSLVRWSHKFVV
jgi:hypothetical protein